MGGRRWKERGEITLALNLQSSHLTALYYCLRVDISSGATAVFAIGKPISALPGDGIRLRAVPPQRIRYVHDKTASFNYKNEF